MTKSLKEKKNHHLSKFTEPKILRLFFCCTQLAIKTDIKTHSSTNEQIASLIASILNQFISRENFSLTSQFKVFGCYLVNDLKFF